MNRRNGPFEKAMDTLNGLLAFTKTAELGSFVAAGNALALSASAVGKAVGRLEEEMGVRLIQRSTRRMQLTPEGQLFHERCQRILDELQDARSMLTQAQQAPRGKLRVSAPVAACHFLMPLLPDFLARHPEVELDIHFDDRGGGLIDDSVDLAIRSGDLPDSGLVHRPLHRFHLRLWAAPAYLQRRGTPETLHALGRHEAIRFRHPGSGKLLDWPLLVAAEGMGDWQRPRTVLACNNIEAVRDAALRGVGLACMPDFLAGEAAQAERLVPVLTEVVGARGRYNALWPSSRHLSPKVRAFVDYLAEGLGRR